MPSNNLSIHDLTDEEVLKEFVKRFQCDGAVLIYLDSSSEFGFGRWKTSLGRKWVKNIFEAVKTEEKKICNNTYINNRKTNIQPFTETV